MAVSLEVTYLLFCPLVLETFLWKIFQTKQTLHISVTVSSALSLLFVQGSLKVVSYYLPMQLLTGYPLYFIPYKL